MREKADIDYIISWHGFGYPDRRSELWDSLCRVRIWQQKPIIVLFSDLNEEDTGTSITNCSENLATLVQFHFKLENPIRWFEHYSYHNLPERKKKQLMFNESLSEIFYSHDGQRYYQPKWKPFSPSSLESLVNTSISMTDYQTVKKLHLQTLWEHNQDEFARGKADALFRNPRIYPPHSEAYKQGYQYGIAQQSERVFFKLRKQPQKALSDRAHALTVLDIKLGVHKGDGKSPFVCPLERLAPAIEQVGVEKVVERRERKVKLIGTPICSLMIPKSSETGQLILSLWEQYQDFPTKFQDDVRDHDDGEGDEEYDF